MFYRLVLKYFTPYVFSVILLQSFVQATDNGCPPSELVQPCTCKSRSGKADIECVGIKHYGDLVNVFNKLDGWRFRILHILQCSMLYIPSAIFEKSKFRKIMIQDSSFTSLFDTTPTSVKCVKHFHIYAGIFHQEIGWKYFKNFKLYTLEIRKAIVRELGKEFKENIFSSNIRHITFEENGIRRLTDQPFENFQNLMTLNLESQNFSNLEPLILPHSLLVISLRNNNLRSLPDHFFGERPNLDVFIGNNQLTNFPKTVFGGVFSVMADGNPLECTCGMKWITELKIKNNRNFGQCASPSTVKGKRILQLSASDFTYCS